MENNKLQGYHVPKSSLIRRLMCEHDWYFAGMGENILGMEAPGFRCSKCGKVKFDPNNKRR